MLQCVPLRDEYYVQYLGIICWLDLVLYRIIRTNITMHFRQKMNGLRQEVDRKKKEWELIKISSTKLEENFRRFYLFKPESLSQYSD